MRYCFFNRMGKYDAVLFDLLSGLIDSWELWDSVAGNADAGYAWRKEYLDLTYSAGQYRDIEELIQIAATNAPVGQHAADELIQRWDELSPWAEATTILQDIHKDGIAIGVVTNCSDKLGRRAAAQPGVEFDVVATAEAAGQYKPDPAPYEYALEQLQIPPEKVLFVSGSGRDIPGAWAVGMDAVWHNRRELTPPPGITGVETMETLAELPQYIRGDRSP